MEKDKFDLPAPRPKGKRLSRDEWADAKRWFETDPAVTFSDVARKYSVSRQTVQHKAKKDGWDKLVPAREITGRAHALADKRSPDTDNDQIVAGFERIQASTGNVDREVDKAIDSAVDKRAVILERHRSEMNLARREIYAALKSKSLDGLRMGKLAAEALKIIQDAERKAWALDAGEDAPHTVIIERTNG